MLTLHRSLKHWKSISFKEIFKSEFLKLDLSTLPLHQSTTQGGYVDYTNIELTLLSTTENVRDILIKTGLFFNEIVGGCNCEDDPIEINNYCILLISINKNTARCSFSLLDE